MADHDLLIRVSEQVVVLTAHLKDYERGSIERDTRIEAKVDRINGQVGAHDAALRDIASARLIPRFEAMEGEWKAAVGPRVEMWEQVKEMWRAYTVGRWVMGFLILLQPIEIAVAVAVSQRL